MDEDKLIAFLRKIVHCSPKVLRGIGEDAAVIRWEGKRDLLLKTDMIVEKVHFDPRSSREEQWGWKAVACNVSDIAAMGGCPRFALVSVGLPRNCPLERAKKIHQGIRRACHRFRIDLVGGDTSRCSAVVISIAMVGEVEHGKAVLRSAARPGDVVFVTGKIGGSLESGRHLTFMPRFRESRYLVKHYKVHAMIDLSDGLSKDLGHLARESGVGFRIYEASLPVHRGVRSFRSAFLDGEDFELVFTLRPAEALRLLKDHRARRMGFVFYPIGRVVKEKDRSRMVTCDGRILPFPKPRDPHFGH